MQRRRTDIQPDPAFYAAIGGDETVKRVLEIFYDWVFDDPQLLPFFTHVDKPTLRGKQFSFMKRCFLGDKSVYMGQRPRNAHHWMVIDEALFDHRQALMRRALEAIEMAPQNIERWLGTEEVFRQQIVKDTPIPLHYQGVATYWAEDAKEESLAMDALCDRCHQEVAAGSSLWVLGDVAHCRACMELARDREG